MSVETKDHWTNHVSEPDEAKRLDDLELSILTHKDAIKELQRERRKIIHAATGRMRRARQ